MSIMDQLLKTGGSERLESAENLKANKFCEARLRRGESGITFEVAPDPRFDGAYTARIMPQGCMGGGGPMAGPRRKGR